ncbi:hypothetical protein RhiirA5_427329 [Rhizophagus irregularis]|uniref:RNase H type-1 domain-containing protein n=2 Tax=Rhizophagus irregularis TaxID=588596 RepID=A0A2N0P2J3_9GLOM|nr:hypothetical protein RhiirA5_427329 [Rhizophagus irregularis]GBC44372.1 hypothetical protein GLOIN_2v1785823 [Rhizophagus irregularis DAOM 181602=DAOM 197198]
MSTVWIALDDDGLILESSSTNIPNTYSSALRSEVAALLFVDKPFLPKLLCQSNHLLWLFIWNLLHTNNLSVVFSKVSAHKEDLLNNHVQVKIKANIA